MDFKKQLSKLLGNDKSINEVQIDSRVIDEIIKIAIEADPREYVALLSGKFQEDILKITGLIFLPFKASENSAVMQVFMMPLTTKSVGSVHSHPGPSANPSEADLRFFAKNGYFHMIVCRPYSQATMKAYDPFGNPIPFVVKDLGDEIEIKQWDEMDFDKELFDESFVEELKKLEKENNEEENNQQEENEDEPIQKEENITKIDENLTQADDNIKEDKIMSKQENNQTQINSQSNRPATLNLEIDIKGKKVLKEIPLPPEYEPGDHVEVDIRTDKTPNDDIDEIRVHVIKAKDIKKNNKVITVTPQKVGPVNRAQSQNQNQSPSKIEAPQKENPSQSVSESESNTNKSSEEIENEIKQMEEDIAKLKAENERLKNNM